jgi:hypothetical protein
MTDTFHTTAKDCRAIEALELTILLPCLNEAETIESCIEKGMSYLARNGVRGEVLVADNRIDRWLAAIGNR